MSWAEIRKRMKENCLSYDWMKEMLLRWRGVATTNAALRTAACTDTNDKLRANVGLVLERYERLINGEH